MYVCNCNGITETEVREAVRNGARKWDDVHAYFDCAPCCGKCQGDMENAICQARYGAEPAAEPVFGAPEPVAAG